MMGMCSTFKNDQASRRRKMIPNPTAHRDLVISVFCAVSQAVHTGDKIGAEQHMIQLAYLTDATWYLEKGERRGLT